MAGKEIQGIWTWIKVNTSDLGRAEKESAKFEKTVASNTKNGRQEQARFERQYSDVMTKEYAKRKAALDKALQDEIKMIKTTYSGAKLPAISDAIKKFRGDLENLNKTAIDTKGKFGGKGLFGDLAATGAAIGGIAAIKTAITSMIGASTKAESAILGLAAVVQKNLGAGAIPEATKAVEKLSATGIMSASGAGQAMKNLISMGYSINDATEFLEANAKMATVSRQSHYSLEESIVVVTEGLKNQISVLTDATGLSTNLSKILERQGMKLEDLDDKTKGAAARQHILNAFVEEGSQYTDVAAKKMAGYEGETAKLDASLTKVSASGGDMLKKFLTPFISFARSVVSYIADLSDTAKMVGGITLATAALIPVISGAIPLMSAFWIAVTGPVGIAAAVVASLGAMSVALIDWMDRVDKAQQQHQKVSAQAGLNKYMSGQSAPNAIAAQVLGSQNQGGVSQATIQSMKAVQAAATAAVPSVNAYTNAVSNAGSAAQKTQKDITDLLLSMRPVDKTIENLTTKSQKAAEAEKQLGEDMKFAAGSAEQLADAVGNKSASGFAKLAQSIATFAGANPILIGVLAGVSAAFAIYEKWFDKKKDEIPLAERLLKIETDRKQIMQDQLGLIGEQIESTKEYYDLIGKESIDAQRQGFSQLSGFGSDPLLGKIAKELTGTKQGAKIDMAAVERSAKETMEITSSLVAWQTALNAMSGVVGGGVTEQQRSKTLVTLRQSRKRIKNATLAGYVDDMIRALESAQRETKEVAVTQGRNRGTKTVTLDTLSINFDLSQTLTKSENYIEGVKKVNDIVQGIGEELKEIAEQEKENADITDTRLSGMDSTKSDEEEITKREKEIADELEKQAKILEEQAALRQRNAELRMDQLDRDNDIRNIKIESEKEKLKQHYFDLANLTKEEIEIKAKKEKLQADIDSYVNNAILTQEQIDTDWFSKQYKGSWADDARDEAIEYIASLKQQTEQAYIELKKLDSVAAKVEDVSASIVSKSNVINLLQKDTTTGERREKLETLRGLQTAEQEAADVRGIWERTLGKIQRIALSDLTAGLGAEDADNILSNLENFEVTAREKLQRELDVKVEQTINNNVNNYAWNQNGDTFGPQEWLESKVLGSLREMNRLSGGRLFSGGRRVVA